MYGVVPRLLVVIWLGVGLLAWGAMPAQAGMIAFDSHEFGYTGSVTYTNPSSGAQQTVGMSSGSDPSRNAMLTWISGIFAFGGPYGSNEPFNIGLFDLGEASLSSTDTYWSSDLTEFNLTITGNNTGAGNSTHSNQQATAVLPGAGGAMFGWWNSWSLTLTTTFSQPANFLDDGQGGTYVNGVVDYSTGSSTIFPIVSITGRFTGTFVADVPSGMGFPTQTFWDLTLGDSLFDPNEPLAQLPTGVGGMGGSPPIYDSTVAASPNVGATPEPGTMLLLGSASLAMAWIRRKKRA